MNVYQPTVSFSPLFKDNYSTLQKSESKSLGLCEEENFPFSLKVPEDDYFYLDNYLSYYEDYYYHLFLKDSFIIKSFFYTEKK